MKYIAPEEARTRIDNLKYLEDLRQLSRNNRKNPIESEKLFWKILNYKKLNLKFTRQKPIGRFILDFYCSKLLLAIEIDGGSHNKKENYDEGRDLYLEQRGIKTIRFKNEEIENSLEEVKKHLYQVIFDRKNELGF
ncbi:MAG: endonuclease domain-containing protein [Candidatus Shapirobacteria bacterium]